MHHFWLFAGVLCAAVAMSVALSHSFAVKHELNEQQEKYMD
jgi:hypothetical protein